MWLILGFVSAFFLGTYDIAKKLSLQNNAVIPVLFLSVVFSSLILSPFLIISWFCPSVLQGGIFFVPEVDFRTHMFILLKSFIVLSSWLFAYFGVKYLPITVASPVKATQPIWTVLGALIIFGERLNLYQSIGVGIALVSFFLFSVNGKKEGISFRTNKWFVFLVIGTLTGAVSGLYDKYLMKQFDHMAVQVYYTIYQALIMAVILLIVWYPTRKKTTPFQFKWSIVFISVLLITADFVYFYALTMPNSMISIMSTIRRGGVVIPFLYGAIIMKDTNLKTRSLYLVEVLVGMIFLYLGSK
jgi:bacterial/archaeal transporter family protein